MIIGAVPFSAKENRMKKIGKFLSSMGFAVTLLVLLAAACALCSLVEQGLPPEMYEARYGKQAASVLIALQVNDAYHSVWFIALTGFLCLNLTLCSILRFSSFRKRWKGNGIRAARRIRPETWAKRRRSSRRRFFPRWACRSRYAAGGRTEAKRCTRPGTASVCGARGCATSAYCC